MAKTMAYFNTRYTVLSARRSDLLGRPAENPARRVEKFRSLAAVELMIADLHEEIVRTPGVAETSLETSAFIDAARSCRAEAKEWRWYIARAERAQVAEAVVAGAR